MSNKSNNIDLMNRDSLVNLAEKLKIKGYTNKYKSPYLSKEKIKKKILEEVGVVKTFNKSHSLSNINSNNNGNNNSGSISKIKLKKSKSLSALNKRSKKVNYNINVNIDSTKCIFPKVKKIVAIGDIHGDLSVAIKALKLAGVINLSIDDNIRDISNINWTGGNTYVVQLGDQIDRVRPNKLVNNLCIEEDEDICDDEGSDLRIISLFEKLHKQAQDKNGALLSVLGNHELMNIDGDFRYVSPKEFAEFGNYFKGKYEQNSKVPFGYKERLEVFKPGGILAKKLANTRYSALQVGSWIFVHGGISGDCASKYSLKDMNHYMKNWIMGNNSKEINDALNYLYHNDDDDNSPFWSRIYSDMDEWDEHSSIENFKKTLHYLNMKNLNNNKDNIIKGMIMGHSPQFMYNKGINSSFNNKIWRVDIGASKAFGQVDNSNECKHRKVHVLVIEDDNKFSIIKEKC